MQIQLKFRKRSMGEGWRADRILRMALSRKTKLCADLKHCGACLLIKYKLRSFIISSRVCLILVFLLLLLWLAIKLRFEVDATLVLQIKSNFTVL